MNTKNKTLEISKLAIVSMPLLSSGVAFAQSTGGLSGSVTGGSDATGSSLGGTVTGGSTVTGTLSGGGGSSVSGTVTGGGGGGGGGSSSGGGGGGAVLGDSTGSGGVGPITIEIPDGQVLGAQTGFPATGIGPAYFPWGALLATILIAMFLASVFSRYQKNA